MDTNLQAVLSGKLTNEVMDSLSISKKDRADIEKYHLEYSDLDRSIRDTQVGKTQIDKLISKKVKEKDASGNVLKDENGKVKKGKDFELPNIEKFLF